MSISISISSAYQHLRKPAGYNMLYASSMAGVSGNFSRYASSRNIMSLHDPMPEFEANRHVPIFWLNEVSSTMDIAKELDKYPVAQSHDIFAVVADRQIKGRGTHGRQWLSAQNNMYLTIALKRSSIPIPLTLTPLRVGALVASAVQSRITSGATVTLKWPNDILISGKKICGVLMEMEGDRLIIGIGCNVASSPNVTDVKAPTIRQATSLAEHNEHIFSYIQSEIERKEEQAASAENVVVDAGGNTVLPTDTTTILDHTTAVSFSSQSTETDAKDAHASTLHPSTITLQAGDFNKDLAIDVCESVWKWITSADDTVE
jgi:biotin-[acetyl-CoA-carboxylase] ligase BirA-like protein